MNLASGDLFSFFTWFSFYAIFSLYVFPKPGRTRTVRRTQRRQLLQPVAAHGDGVQLIVPCEKIQSNFLSILSYAISHGGGVQHTAPYEKIQSNFISILFYPISLGDGVQSFAPCDNYDKTVRANPILTFVTSNPFYLIFDKYPGCSMNLKGYKVKRKF